jgi:hypothetical protein
VKNKALGSILNFGSFFILTPLYKLLVILKMFLGLKYILTEIFVCTGSFSFVNQLPFIP